MKKLGFVILLLGFLAAPALAQNQPFEASVIQTGNQGNLTVFQRYWTEVKPDVSPGCAGACGSGGANCDLTDPAQPTCKLSYNTTRNAYRGYSEQMLNFGSPGNGTVFNSLFEYQANAGSATHTGFFAWARGAASEGETSLWYEPGCAGTNGTSCIGNPGTADAIDEANTPQGVIAKRGGLQPIPVPKASAQGTRDSFPLSWTAVTSDGKAAGAAVLGYDLYVAKTSACAAPTEAQFTFLRTVAGTSTTVTSAEAGLGADDTPTFALKIRFPGTFDGKVITTKYLSANGQCFGRGLASTVYDLAARHVGGTNVEVTFKTSLEDGVQSFDIMRATTQNGEFTKVGNVAAKGEASSYSFIDAIQVPQGQVRATGLFYKVVAIDVDNGTSSYGPVKASLPSQGQGTIRQQMKKPAPKR